MNNLNSIIQQTTGSPTIVNEDSNFVVVTYWWGKGNLNNNTARPCVSFYENFTSKLITKYVNILSTSNAINVNAIIAKLPEFIVSSWVNKVLINASNDYMYDMYKYAGISEKGDTNDDRAMRFFEKGKETGSTPIGFEYKTKEYVYMVFLFIAAEFIKLNKEHIIELFKITKIVEDLKVSYLNTSSASEQLKIKKSLNAQIERKTNITTSIKKSLNVKNNYTNETNLFAPKIAKLLNPMYDKYINQKSLNEILIQELRYKSPDLFETMIQNWETQCSSQKCNYLAIEYSEFAKPGGYQMAINAKPLFIQKMLELCNGRGVVYIDGDMTIRKYPHIFDMPDVDYMARGWWMDPRSGYDIEESILYDPYTFETSGGIMFFGNSNKARLLLNAWVNESYKSYQSGKADDRIISMIFNSQKMLLDMKIIQLPIEYLWLSLDYDERLLESIYDYDNETMQTSIFVDHPACLTSEDTASGSGASSDRTPKFYSFIDEILDPVSESYYEWLVSDTNKYVPALESYTSFMAQTHYPDDGSAQLYQKQLVTQGQSLYENEQPLYITKYNDVFGKKKNAVRENIIQLSNSMSDINKMYTLNSSLNIAEIDRYADSSKLIALIYTLLGQGIDVIVKPDNYSESMYNSLLSNLKTKYDGMEFVFNPIFNNSSVYNEIYRPQINTKQCMYFKSGSRFLREYITMFDTLSAFSNEINYGSYQFMSSVRVAYILNSTNKSGGKKTINGGSNRINFEQEYISATTYKSQLKNGGKPKVHKKRKYKQTKRVKTKKRTHKTSRKLKHSRNRNSKRKTYKYKSNLKSKKNKKNVYI